VARRLRLGSMPGPAELIREARALRRLMLRHPPANNQRTVALFLALGHHDSLMRRLSHAFRERWQVMRDALARHLPQCKAWSSIGGTPSWIAGPPPPAARAGTLRERGDDHFLGPPPPRHAFRLGFSSIPVERIESGLQKLGDIIGA